MNLKEKDDPRKEDPRTPAAADEPGALEQPRRHFTKVSVSPTILVLVNPRRYTDRHKHY